MDWERFEFAYRLEAGGHQRLLITIEAYREAAELDLSAISRY